METKICIAMASEDIMHVSTCQSIAGMCIGDPNIIDFAVRKSCDIVSNRTLLVKHAIEIGATHICFVDSDMIFPKDVLKTLLAHGKDIISVEYNKRVFPLEKVTKPWPETEASITELYKAWSAGMGLMLINLNVFTDGKLGSPWFNFGRDSEGKMTLGEDAWFIHTANDAGYDTWIDPSIKVGHVGEYIF